MALVYPAYQAIIIVMVYTQVYWRLYESAKENLSSTSSIYALWNVFYFGQIMSVPVIAGPVIAGPVMCEMPKPQLS